MKIYQVLKPKYIFHLHLLQIHQKKITDFFFYTKLVYKEQRKQGEERLCDESLPEEPKFLSKSK